MVSQHPTCSVSLSWMHQRCFLGPHAGLWINHVHACQPNGHVLSCDMQSIHLGANISTALMVRHVVFRMRCLRVQQACQPSFTSEEAVQLRREQSTDQDPWKGRSFILWQRTYWSRALAARFRSPAGGMIRTFVGAQSLTLNTASRLATRNALGHIVGRGTTLGAMLQWMFRDAMAQP